MIMVIWSWLWSENDHDQRTPIMGAVCCVWSLIRAQQQLRLNSQLQIAKACGNPSIAISERVLKPRPALWSSELILTTGTFLWPDPVLRDNNQFWIHTKSRSGSNFRTSSDHTGEELQEKTHFLRKNANLHFLILEEKKRLNFVSRLLQLWSQDVKPATKQSLNKCATKTGRLRTSHVTCWSHVTTVWQEEWQVGAFDKVGAWVWQLLYPPQ